MTRGSVALLLRPAQFPAYQPDDPVGQGTTVLLGQFPGLLLQLGIDAHIEDLVFRHRTGIPTL